MIIARRAEAIHGLVMEDDQHAEQRMERDALSLVMRMEEGAEMVRVLEAMEGLVLEEEDYENAEGMERDPLSLSRILFRVAVYTITYTTGIFPEKYFNDTFVPELDMILKELAPMNEESETLIDWMEEGVGDSAKGKYLKTLIFSSCEHKEDSENEEFAFSFSYSSNRKGELAVKLCWVGSNTEKLTLKFNAGDLAPQRMRSSACKLIRMCALCTGMLDVMQEGKQKKMDDADDSYDSKEMSKRGSGFLFCAATRRYPLFLDSGSSYHVCNTRDCLRNCKRLNKPIALCSVEKNELKAHEVGDLIHQDVKLTGVLFVPHIQFSIVSVGLLDKQGLMVCIGDGRFSVYDVEKPALVGHGVLNRVDKDYAFCSMDWLKSEYSEDVNEEEIELEILDGWIVDSLCANHMVGDKTLLSDCVPVKREFQTASGTIVCTLKGSVRTATMVLFDVLYSEEINSNLISVSQLDEKGFSFTFYKRRCEIQLRDPIHSSGHASLNLRSNHYILYEFTEEKPLPDPDVTPIKKRTREEKEQ
ncbi:hypothetical protein ACQ4PT_006859 [Festuca glaucescens]